jgi:hypothetical protein
MPSPAASPPRLPNQALRPGKPQQRPVTTPGPVQGLASKRQPLARREAMAPTNLFFDTQPGSVTTDSVQPGTITGDSIAFNTITGQNIVAGSIAADSIAAGSITADKLNVSQLSAITADMGTLTAGTITGATVRTSATNPRVVFDSSGITATNGAGATTFRVDSATGNVTATGGTFTGSSFVGGSFSGGTFTGVTFTGGTFQSSATNPRVWFDTTGIHATNPAGTEVFRVDAATGNLTATGATITGGTFVGSVFETSAANPKVRIDATGIRMTATDGTTTFYADSSTGVLTLGNPAGSKITFDPALASMQRLYLEGRLVGTGTIMGPSFETGVNNPRMVIDQFGIRAYPPGTFPSTALKDDFNRANTGPPPSGSWLADFRGDNCNAFKIVSNRAVPSFAAGDNESGMYWNVLTTTSDHEVFCDINVEADVELWARIQWTNPAGVTAYVCEYTASDHSLRVQRYGPGGPGWYTDISTVVNVGFTAGMSIGIRVVGQSITLFHKAAGASVYSQVVQVSDPDPPYPEFTSGDKWGVMCWQMSPSASPLAIDNIGGGDYVPVGGGTPTFAVDTGTGSMTVQGGAITAGLVQTDDENPRIVMDSYRDAGGVMRGRFRATDASGAALFSIQDGIVTNIGGTVQSAAANPKVVLGPAGLFSYDSAGNVMFKADPADTGKATLFNGSLTGTTRNTGTLEHRLPAPGIMRPLTWTLSGTQIGSLDFDDGGRFSLWSKSLFDIVSQATVPGSIGGETVNFGRAYIRPDLAQLLQQNSAGQLSVVSLAPDSASMSMNGNRAFILSTAGCSLQGDATNDTYFRLASGAVDSFFRTSVAGNAFVFATGAAQTNPLRIINGKVVVNSELGFGCSKANFNHKIGCTCWGTAVNSQYGQYDNYKQVRTDGDGNLITPSSGTFSGSPYANTRIAAVGVGTIHADGCMWNLACSATGAIVQYFNFMTMA